MRPIPDWWADSADVVGLHGERGTLYGGADGVPYTVLLEDGRTVFANPDPAYWFRRPKPQIGFQQLRRILYECDRAFVASCGRSAMTEWISVPESQRTAIDAPRCSPLTEDEASSLRRLIEATLREALEPYVNRYAT